MLQSPLNAEEIAEAGPKALTDDVPVEIRKDLMRNQTFAEAAKEGARKRYVAMQKRQTAIKRDLDSVGHKSVNGLGQHVARIDAEMYFQVRAIYGDSCWDDPEFLEAFLNDPRNANCRVDTKYGTRGQEYLRK